MFINLFQMIIMSYCGVTKNNEGLLTETNLRNFTSLQGKILTTGNCRSTQTCGPDIRWHVVN